MNRPHEPIEQHYQDDHGKREFIRDLFNRSAPHYDRIGAIGFWGTGHAYRKRALRRAGLQPGMQALDVACGTGAVTRAAEEVLEGQGAVFGVDPSEGMMAEARKSVSAELRLGHAEALPFPDENFDFLSMGYALRHVDDLYDAFKEYHRALRPGGKILILEISRPKTHFGMVASRLYFRDILPRISGLITGSTDAREMMTYYWETIEACVPPDSILDAMRKAGFQDVRRHVELGIFSEYQAIRP